jgi:hypothetical protein
MYRVKKRNTFDVNAHNNYLVLVYLTTLAVPQVSDHTMNLCNRVTKHAACGQNFVRGDNRNEGRYFNSFPGEAETERRRDFENLRTI